MTILEEEKLELPKNISIIFYSVGDTPKLDFVSSISGYLRFLGESMMIVPHYLEDIHQDRKGITLDRISFQALEIDDNTYYEFYTPKEEYSMHISTSGHHFSYVSIDFQTTYLLKIMQPQDFITFFKKSLLQFKQFNYAPVYSHSPQHLIYKLYGDFNFNGRNSSFKGFTWLLYLSNEEVAKNGGEALLKIPHLTHVERLPEGVLFQVGDSPLDALTPSGEEQLYLATKAWCDIVGCSKPLFRLP